ncbi:ATP-binding protein [Erythrobacter sp. LQ02-29]|uniref:sensor histidine kinase n=1 Tax=Erythrobacter sp. LQ02-29 TaxID=2920384 RepID=UPI001F4EA797|nr:ATP-binding protein [Erythrobacter sp. LQ02-29]MCP9223259.1 ATP-binding protein [Erythrobacter sp. LQ02-29]
MVSVTPPRNSASASFAKRKLMSMRRADIFTVLEIGASVAFVIMVGTTWLAFSGRSDSDHILMASQVAALLVGTLLPTMVLLVLGGRRLARRRAAGSTARLHTRLVFLFSIIAAVPTLLVSAFAAFLFQSGVDFWMSGESRGVMEQANRLARGYFEQNQLEVKNETYSMAGDILFLLQRQESPDLGDREFLSRYSDQMQGRDINESAILQAFPDGRMTTALAIGLTEGNEPAKAGERALPLFERGETEAVFADPTRIEAITPIDREAGIYLYNARNTEALSFSQWKQASSVVASYDALTARARALQLQFNLALFFVSLLLVGLAVWFALRFADRQVEPLTDLVAAARKVGAGNFAMRVEERRGGDEVGLLNRAFNRMTAQLEKQTDALVSANRQLDERRGFIEAVLESITSGIISTDGSGEILLMNPSARAVLLGKEEIEAAGKPLEDISPAIAAMVESGAKGGVVSHERDKKIMTLAVRVTSSSTGHVVTFEDITRQLLDQRQAAWSDVARRIAHEIKNPLTPIQLATERLKRRYRKQIANDGDLFDELTSTIVRQVGTLRNMVDEFSSFARLPKPVFRREDPADLVRQSLFLQEVAHPAVDFALALAIDDDLRIECDRHQFGQAMTNVLKNAVEAVEARARGAEPDYRGRVGVTVDAGETLLSITVEDNGVGLPNEPERIVEPYVTMREKGTGLGLAIVNKIVEEHGGDMAFRRVEGGGTRVVLSFARDPNALATEAAE